MVTSILGLGRQNKPSSIAILIPFFALLLVACSSTGEGSWVTNNDPLAASTDSVFYLMEEKSPFGENEKNEDSQGYRRICLLLEFAPPAAGSDEWVVQPIDDAEWRLCRHLESADKPKFAASSIPAELRGKLGVD
jgi:hypothetical protein